MTSKSMKVSWQMLSDDDANGVISGYEICYKASNTMSEIDCTLNVTINNGSTVEAILDGLNEATTYNVAVRAKNTVGFGMLGPVMTDKTLEDSKLFHKNVINK